MAFSEVGLDTCKDSFGWGLLRQRVRWEVIQADKSLVLAVRVGGCTERCIRVQAVNGELGCRLWVQSFLGSRSCSFARTVGE